MHGVLADHHGAHLSQRPRASSIQVQVITTAHHLIAEGKVSSPSSVTSVRMTETRLGAWRWPLTLLLVLVTIGSTTRAAKHEDFKTCSQSSFCRRLRSLPERAQASGFHSPYSLGDGHFTDDKHRDRASWTFPLNTELYPEITFALTVDFLAKGDGIARLRVDEVGSKLPWKRYNEAGKWALVDPEPALASVGSVKRVSSRERTHFKYGNKSELELVVDHAPFKVTFRRNGEDVMYVNERNLFHMEHFRSKEETPAQVEGGDAAATSDQQVFSASTGKKDTTWFEGEPDKELWEERFSKWTDSKPKGACGALFDCAYLTSF
jgi:alpha 1,3-glucosidase